jgi:hypothetical protein
MTILGDLSKIDSLQKRATLTSLKHSSNALFFDFAAKTWEEVRDLRVIAIHLANTASFLLFLKV